MEPAPAAGVSRGLKPTVRSLLPPRKHPVMTLFPLFDLVLHRITHLPFPPGGH